MSKQISNILKELTSNAEKIEDTQINQMITQLKNANHIFLAGAGRSGIVVQAFANRLMHLGFSVSLVGEVTSPHSQPGDLLIICSGSGETASLKTLATRAASQDVVISLITMNKYSSIAKLASSAIILPGRLKTDVVEKSTNYFSQPMGSSFEQLSFLLFDSIVLDLMYELSETSESMFARHADFE